MTFDVAHGVGRVYEAPLPVWLYGVGAAITVLLSFFLRAILKTRPLDRAPRRLLGPEATTVVVRVLRVVGLGGLLLAIVAGLLVRDRGLSLAPLLFWIALIIGVTAVNAVVSGYWDAVDPWATIERFYRLDAPQDTAVPRWWVGPMLLYALFWFELVSGIGFEAVPVVAVLLAYSLFVFTFRLRWGERWPEADPLSLLFGFAGACAPLRLTDDGLYRRAWLSELDRPEETSKAVFASIFVLLGATTLDNVRETTHWHSFLQAARVDELRTQVTDSLALLLFAGLFLLPYAATMWITARLIGADARVRAEMRHFAWSLIPIGVAYLLAHNAPLLMSGAPRLFQALSDPFERGWNLLGTRYMTYFPSPALVWFIEIALIIGGHVLAVLAAHRIAFRRAGSHAAAVRSQIALTVLMSVFTVTTLVLLGQPLVA